MNIPLAEFEQIIDKTILNRGLSYFLDGAVLECITLSTGEYEATISGAEVYTVYLKIEKEIVVQHTCNCPYDYGPVCKHVVASIFYIEDERLNLKIEMLAQPKKNRAKPVGSQVSQLLKKLTHEELVRFVEEKSKTDRKFRTQFMSRFGHLIQDHSKVFYCRQIRNILSAAKERDGWISWGGLREVVNETQPFLDRAEHFLDKKELEAVFNLSVALLEEFTEAFNYADDSNGDLGYFIYSAQELLDKLVACDLPEALRTTMFKYFISTYNKRLFSGWDWHLGMLEYASKIAEHDSEVELILNSLKTVTDEYDSGKVQFFTLSLLRKFKSKDEVALYIEKHIFNSKIREQEILIAYSKADFKHAIKLAKDGVVLDKIDKPGLVNTWTT